MSTHRNVKATKFAMAINDNEYSFKSYYLLDV